MGPREARTETPKAYNSLKALIRVKQDMKHEGIKADRRRSLETGRSKKNTDENPAGIVANEKDGE